ncbi:hypothetical protein RIF29_11045 [Crotalaria pallida]|uniref:U-box domain-containing protein n=1 Tax=Crotalaria pallida TaxID=3830 RepID=A0AAN9IIQ9_CROPI
MTKEDLCITIPSFFKCPISLDLMQSPVSLCTGITYDRSTIQRWLDNGNDTCPATMQLLHTKHFIPNRTLHSLIQIWSDSVHRRFEPPGSTPKDRLLQAIEDVFDSHTANRFDSLVEVLRFAEDSDENRAFLAKIDGFVGKLVRFLCNVDAGVTGSVQFENLENVIRVFGLLLDKIKDRERLNYSNLKEFNCLDSLLLVLRQGSSDSRIASVRVLEFIAVDSESKILMVEKEGLVTELLNSVSDPLLIETSLSTLVAISAPRRNKVKLVNLGVVKMASRFLSESNSSVSATEKVLKLVEMASSTKEGRTEMCCGDAACIAAILSKAMKVSKAATERAVTTLWSVCYLFGDGMAVEAVVKANGLGKILLLMQTNCSSQVRQMCVDLLKILRVNAKSCIPSYITNSAHIMPF